MLSSRATSALASLMLGAMTLAPANAAVRVAAAAAHGPVHQVGRALASHTLATLHSFTGTDGANPQGALNLAFKYNGGFSIDSILYGETQFDSAAGNGTIYSADLGAGVFASAYAFAGSPDGATPTGGLNQNIGDYLTYGTPQFGVTQNGGTAGFGTLFRFATGKVTVLHTFTGGADGANPQGRLVLFTDGNYYGTTSAGAAGFGTVFKLSRSGKFTTIHTFTGGTDGGTPLAGLAPRVDLRGDANATSIARQNNVIDASHVDARFISHYLYGVTSTGGGPSGGGTIFAISPSGAFATVYSFTDGADGAAPAAELSTDLSGNLYGTATAGGSDNVGTVFALTAKNAFVLLHDFSVDPATGIGLGGAIPLAPITVALNGAIYGTTSAGGTGGNGFGLGTVFKISRSGFASIHSFNGTDGATPAGKLVDGGNGNLYGTTENGGANGSGSLFAIGE